MKTVLLVIFVPLAVICLGAFLFAGIKALFKQIKARVKNKFSHEKTPPEAMMDIVTLTSGTCQSCGKTFIGTTEDKNPPLRVVNFMGESRILCNECLERILAEFNRSQSSEETRYTQSALKLKELLASTRSMPK